MSGRGDLQCNMDYNPQGAWDFLWPESSSFGRDKGFILREKESAKLGWE